MKILLCLFITMFQLHLAFSQRDTTNSINGIWEMNGYGRIIEISDLEVSTYDITKISCLVNSKLSRADINQLGQFNLTHKDSLHLKLGITHYYLHRIKKLPPVQIITDSIQSKNLKLNFDVFWHTLNENYSFFKERKMNWKHIYTDYSNRVDTLTNEQDLYDVFLEITGKLNDEHTTVIPNDAIRKAHEELMDIQEENDGIPHISISELSETIVHKYVENPIKYGKSLSGNGLLNYGVTANNVGYIQANNMIFFADYKLPDTLTDYDFLFAYLDASNKNPSYQEDEVKGIKYQMDSIMDRFKNTDAIILDLRFNTGGYDVVSLEILNYFIDTKKKVFSKKAKTIDGFTSAQSHYIIPTKKAYKKPVFFLTSPQTSSAPESLVIAAMPYENIKVIGSRTMGITSDVLEKKLPNGWDLFLSNEILVNYKGDCFEGVGVPPDIEIDYARDEDQFIQELSSQLKNGDKAIEKAFALLKNE
ncbi:S41 family peptidase [Cellulophaga baltica]|uniref:S41 family peptidase n=1 Tax=Cellulophaga baltica TaxID=76594 RepID=UPI0021497E28|nr:S41 family peptidase [Cellulophaga baltica]MCR1027006.1 S41 family peptidase [Cellulophaga baltica]